MANTISHNQNVAITMAKAFHVLATCLGDTDMINNAQEHLDCACDNGLYDYEATRHATIDAMDKLIRSTQKPSNPEYWGPHSLVDTSMEY